MKLKMGQTLFVVFLLSLSSAAWAATYEVTAPTGLNFWDDSDKFVVALPKHQKVESTGKQIGNWGQFKLPNGRIGWGFLGYMRNLTNPGACDAKTDAQHCNNCNRAKGPMAYHRDITQHAMAAHDRPGYVFPVPPKLNPRRGFQMVEDPWSGRRYMHQGQDFYADRGTSVKAAKDGTVVEVLKGCSDSPSASSMGRQCGGGLGNFIKIRHADGHYSVYSHLENSQHCAAIRKIAVGEVVTRSQPIGCVGASGRATGAHLYFQIETASSQPVNPLSFIIRGLGL